MQPNLPHLPFSSILPREKHNKLTSEVRKENSDRHRSVIRGARGREREREKRRRRFASSDDDGFRFCVGKGEGSLWDPLGSVGPLGWREGRGN